LLDERSDRLREPCLLERVLELGELVPVIADEDARPKQGDDLETDAVGILEEGCVLVVGVLGR
jgi:hypothetical protein